MEIIPMLLKELENEANTTRKMLALVPDDKHDWKPHSKSMEMGRLATHIAELPGWVSMAIHSDELDFNASEYKPTILKSSQELLECLEKNLESARGALNGTNEEQLKKDWTMRSGERIFSTDPKVDVIRMAYCQTVHHRAQLGVYLRVLDIPIPGSYGPSADDPSF